MGVLVTMSRLVSVYVRGGNRYWLQFMCSDWWVWAFECAGSASMRGWDNVKRNFNSKIHVKNKDKISGHSQGYSESE